MRRRESWLLVVALIMVLCGAALPARQAAASSVRIDPRLSQALVSASPDTRLGVILTFDTRPGSDLLRLLTGQGVAIAPLRHLPMLGALATPAQLAWLRGLPGLRSIYSNRPLEWLLRESVPLIGATAVWQEYGLQGEGVGVAVLDTGIDATHPDLRYGERTVQNVKIVGLQYAAGVNLDGLGLPALYLEDQLNSDTTGGHGTHVAGIIGASGAASNGLYRGVAPKAPLIGLGAGDVIEIFTALAGFDWILEHRQTYNIRVVNCSWGNIVPGFDPDDPVNIATRAVHDAGIAVVFAAGNSGATTNTLNTYSVAPWVIGVAAGDKNGKDVAFFSSRGIPGDDFFHPTLTAPGHLIVSDRASTGLATTPNTTPLDPIYVQPEYLPFYTTASGTSMAAPHVAGTIALMVQANPRLTPDVIKRVLVTTATPMPGYQEYAAGAGYLNAKAAVDQARQIKNIRSYRDPRTGKQEQVYDLTTTWNGTLGASLPGMAASDRHALTVVEGTLALDVVVDWDLAANDLNLYLYDPQGQMAASSEVVQAIYGYANETVHLDAPQAGVWTVEVRGLLNAPQSYRATANAVVRAVP